MDLDIKKEFDLKKKLKFLVICLPFIHLSCEKDITVPDFENVSIQIDDHILQGYFVTCISFDSKGTAWIGTFKQGLIKYDGRAVYYHSKNSALPDSLAMWDISVDKNDIVWIGSDIGLIKYDQKEFTLYNTSNSPLAENAVWSIAVDADNILWFSSCRFRQGGLMKFDGLNWTLYTPENSELPLNGVRDVIVDGGNNIWAAISEAIGDGSIIKINGEQWTIFGNEDMGFIPYQFGCLAAGVDHDLYVSMDYRISSSRDMNRPNLARYDGRRWTINNPVDREGGSAGYVGKIAVDLFGNVWAALDGRKGFYLAVFNGKKWIFNDSDFPADSGSEIAVDRSNTVWLGTEDGILLIKRVLMVDG